MPLSGTDNALILLAVVAIFFAALVMLNELWELFALWHVRNRKQTKEQQAGDTKQMLPSDYLRKGICRASYARDEHGKAVYADSPKATSWCLVGAYQAWARLLPIEEEDIKLSSDFWNELKLYTTSSVCPLIAYYSDSQDEETVIGAAVYVERKLGLTK